MAAENSVSVVASYVSGQSLLYESYDPRARIRTLYSAACALSEKNSARVTIAVSSPSLVRMLKELGGDTITELKPRQNYLSLERLKKFQEKTSFADHEISLLVKVTLWLQKTPPCGGDREALTFIGKEQSAWDEICCETHECSHDPETCFAARAYQKIPTAKILLVSHTLFYEQLFADREKTFLPLENCIIEEAHLLEDSLTYFLARTVSFSRLRANMTEKYESMSELDALQGSMGLLFAKYAERDSLVLTPELMATAEWRAVEAAAKTFLARMEKISYLSREYAAMAFLLEKNSSAWMCFLQKTPDNTLLFKKAPAEIGSLLEERLYNRSKTVLVASGALTVNGSMTFVRERLKIPAHFTSVQETETVPCELVVAPATILTENPGQTLMLFGSKRALLAKFLEVAPELKAKGFFVYAQDITGGKGKITELFRLDPDHSVIFCTMIFWEKMDLSQLAVHTVMLEKLVFDPPYDPIHQTRARRYLNDFEGYFLPRAILRLKALMEHLALLPTPKKRLILLDDGILKKEYGKTVISSLPRSPVRLPSSHLQR